MTRFLIEFDYSSSNLPPGQEHGQRCGIGLWVRFNRGAWQRCKQINPLKAIEAITELEGEELGNLFKEICENHSS